METSTLHYEHWLAEQLTPTGGLERDALNLKHEKMKGDVSTFLRATYYRWAYQWDGEGEKGVHISVVGDLHVENYGAWACASGSVACGINDYDEACKAPWCSDLVRLGVSAMLGLEANSGLGMASDAALSAILSGYSAGMSVGAVSLGAAATQAMAMPALLKRLLERKSATEFWKDEDKKLVNAEGMPVDAQKALDATLPGGATQIAYKQRDPKKPKGTGSLGRKRYIARAEAGGEQVMAEAKAFAPSAMALWRGGDAGEGGASIVPRLGALADPTNCVRGVWVTRLVTSDAVKIELDDLPKVAPTPADMDELFTWMGTCLAAVHCVSANALDAAKELAGKPDLSGWFSDSINQWKTNVITDWNAFKNNLPGPNA